MITSWSKSRLDDYETCPARAKYKHVDKLKEEEGPALLRGKLIHTELEYYIKGKTDTLSPETKSVHKLAAKYRKLHLRSRVKVELELAFTKDWKETEWLAKDAWLRVKFDVAHILNNNTTVEIIDWKTGGKVDGAGTIIRSPGYADQLQLYGIAAVLAGLGEKAVGKLVYVDHGGQEVTHEGSIVDTGNVHAAMRKWEKRVGPMLRDNILAPRPGYYCRYCAFSSAKNGPCEF